MADMFREMKILLYVKKGTDAGKRLEKAMELISLKAELTIVRTVRALIRELRILWTPKPSILILFSEDRCDLDELFSMKVFFQDIRIILILPDNDRETLALGYQLYPRFISYADSDFADVKLVVEKQQARISSEVKNHKF